MNPIVDLPSLDKILVIISKNKPEKTFVAELNENSIDILVKNLINQGVNGKIVQIWIIYQFNSFIHFLPFGLNLRKRKDGKGKDLNS